MWQLPKHNSPFLQGNPPKFREPFRWTMFTTFRPNDFKHFWKTSWPSNHGTWTHSLGFHFFLTIFDPQQGRLACQIMASQFWGIITQGWTWIWCFSLTFYGLESHGMKITIKLNTIWVRIFLGHFFRASNKQIQWLCGLEHFFFFFWKKQVCGALGIKNNIGVMVSQNWPCVFFFNAAVKQGFWPL